MALYITAQLFRCYLQDKHMPSGFNIQVLNAQIFSGVSKDFSGSSEELQPYLPSLLPCFLASLLVFERTKLADILRKHIILVFPRDSFYQFTTCIETTNVQLSHTDGWQEDAHIASLGKTPS